MKHYFIILMCLFVSATIHSQEENYGITTVFKQDPRIICNECLQTFARMPKEVQFSIERDADDNLYFQINDKSWVKKLFVNKKDGIAIDVVSKKRYACGQKQEDSQIRGVLLPPVYASKLKRKLSPSPIGKDRFRTWVGKVPAELKDEVLEFNILFLNNNNLCRYQTFFNLQAYTWDLLDMGMYLDSLTYKPKLEAVSKDDAYRMKYKTLRFTIPFKKNKADYSQADIKPVYDSLRLTDYDIRQIDIHAYASVEGNLERNLSLQDKRANSIVAALQTFQKELIVPNVSSSENWVEFMIDIEGTKYQDLQQLNKSEIKAKLKKGLSSKLEPYLKNHRKAVINLKLEKKDKYKEKDVPTLIALFNRVVKTKKEEALDIQNSIFEKLKGKESNPDILNKMEIPNQKIFIDFQNKNTSFEYLLDERNLRITNSKLKKLEKLDPKNKKVKYNLMVLKFKYWRYNVDEPIDPKKFKKEILNLSTYGVEKSLIDRMLVNYHIIKSEKDMRKRNYKEKDISVAFIYNNFKNTQMSDSDYLSLAQYLTYYANLKKAERILTDKVKSIDVEENLLFYYLNLTIIDKELTKTTDYRTIMLNAINRNPEKFCSIFNANKSGGVTFQLLVDDYLKDTYCENCKQ
ncbi:hypothetical protein [Wenyingzhuangia sp. IMCC45574]